MRLLPTCALLLSLSAVPILPEPQRLQLHTLPANANDASVDYSALRARLAEQNKVLLTRSRLSARSSRRTRSS